MPYIERFLRDLLDREDRNPKDSGELNYKITKCIADYIKDKGPHYSTYNDIIGVMVCAFIEFVRRVLWRHEDKKIKENGDVYEL